MIRYIALLRGINVGGRRSLAMSTLRDIVVGAGAAHVATYIQSGNVVFSHTNRSVPRLEADLEGRIEAAVGMVVRVMLRTNAQWQDVVAGNPFPDADPKQLHTVFLKGRASPQAFARIDLEALRPEALVIRERHLYLYLPHGMGRARLPVEIERKGPKDVVGTARNWTTVLALQALASA